MLGRIEMLAPGGRCEIKKGKPHKGLYEMLGEMATMEGLALPACAGGETPHFLLALGLRKCLMVVAVLFVIFGASSDTSAPLVTPRSFGSAASLLPVPTSIFLCLPEAWLRVLLFPELPEGIAACMPAWLG